MTIIYLVRHSEPYKIHRGIEEVNESLLFSNIKSPLSVSGEETAKKLSLNEEFKNLDVVYSSDYVRCMSTAKYFAFNNNLKVNISNKLGEREYGVSSYDNLPTDFEKRQLEDENYKMTNGESKKETKSRILNKINELLELYRDKRILIVGHSTAFSFLLSEWCEINYDGPYKFNNKDFFDGKWKYCETFKLIFDNDNLISIENLNYSVGE